MFQQLRSELATAMQQFRSELATAMQQLRSELATAMKQFRSELATATQQLRSELATAIRSELATMEQRMTMAMKREIGTLTTRDELDVLMSRQTGPAGLAVKAA